MKNFNLFRGFSQNLKMYRLRHTVVLLLALLGSQFSWAQLYPVAGTCTGGIGTTLYAPASSTNSLSTSRHAVIYPASQLSGIAGQTLSSLYLWKFSTADMVGTPNLKIYLKETTATDLGASAVDWSTVSTGATLVYDGNPVTATAGVAGWKQLVFSTNFPFTSSANNLMVLFEYVNTGNTVNTTWEYEYTSPCVNTSNNNTGKYVTTTTGTLGTSLASSNYRRPRIAFDYLVSCPWPSGLDATNITSNSATVSWVAGGTETSWDYAVQPAGSGAPTSFSTTSSLTNNVSSLTPGTIYELYVRAKCGGTNGDSAWKGPFTFQTACAPITSLYEGFENTATGNFVPICWTRMAPATTPGSMSVSTTTPAAGTKNVYQYASSTQSPTIVALPEMSNINAGTHWLRLKARVSTASGTLSVGYVTDVTDVGSFVTLQDLTINNTTYTTVDAEYTVAIPSSVPAGARLAIKNANDGKSYYWDEVFWEPIPTCVKPTALVASAITDNSATISWTASVTPPANGYDVYYSTTNTAPTATSTPNMNVAGTSANLTSLTDNTTYYVWVRSVCSTTDKSIWNALPSFETACLPMTSLYEGFETTATGNNVPDCWVRMAPVTTPGSMSISTTTPAAGVNNVYQYASATQNPTIVALPVFSNVNAGTHWLRFKARATTTGGTLSVGYVTDISDVASFVSIEDLTINNTTYTTSDAIYKVIIPTTVPAGARLAIKNKNDAKSYYWDEVNWEPIPTCVAPTSLGASAITDNSATVSWTASTTPPTNGYDVYYSTTNTAPTATTTPSVNVAGTSANLTSLTDNTTYYVWVRSNCSTTDQSIWVALPSFETSCLPVSYMYEGFETTASGNYVPDCWVRMVPVSSPGSMTITTTTPASGTKNVYQYTSTTTNPVIVALPVFSNINAGTHRLRLKARVSSAGGTLSVGYVTDVNDVSSFVSIEDLTINNTTYTDPTAQYNVIIPNTVPAGARLAIHGKNDAKSYYWDDVYWEPNSTCAEPTALTVTSTTTTTATLSWTAPATAPAEGYDVYYSLVNTVPTPSTTPSVNVTTTTANLSSLSPSSMYYVWVRSRCSSTDQSPWVALPSFATACDAVNLPYVQNFESVTTPALPTCTTNQNVGTGNNWGTVASPGYGFTTNALIYSYNTSNAANVWFYTAGINLTAGTNYKISFDYGNNSTTYAPEKLKVAFGTSAVATAMTTQIVDLPNINQAALQSGTYTFTVPTTGVYYFGFNCYSDADKFYLYVDNIAVDVNNLATSEVDTKDSIKVYPNPFHDVITISEIRNVKTVHVMDASGRLVKTIEKPTAQLQLGDLKSGMYILQLAHRDGTTTSVKVIKK